MDRTAFERALQAVTQVSFVALAGCGGMVSTSDGPSPSASESAKATVLPSTPAEDCDAKLKAAFPDGDKEFWSSETPMVSDPALAVCCAKRPEPAGLTPEERSVFAETETERFRSSGCCHVAGVSSTDIGMACTPWGPPVPPSLEHWISSSEELTLEVV